MPSQKSAPRSRRGDPGEERSTTESGLTAEYAPRNRAVGTAMLIVTKVRNSVWNPESAAEVPGPVARVSPEVALDPPSDLRTKRSSGSLNQ
jgi:hypothetical protein